MNSFFGYAALGGFTLALSVHLASLLGIDVQSQVPIVWALHVGGFIVFVPMFIQLIKSNFMADRFVLIRGMPVWSMVVIAILTAYAFLNFFLAFSGAADGFPAVQNGAFVLELRIPLKSATDSIPNPPLVPIQKRHPVQSKPGHPFQ